VIRRGLPLRAWPERDQIAWAEAIADGDIFRGRGPAVHWAETTRNSVIAAYSRWLGFVAVSERVALADHPVERVTGDRLMRYLDHLAETVGTVGRWAYFAHLRDAVRVMFPGKIPEILSRMVARLERECQPRSMAARIVMTPRLTILGKKLMRDAASGAEGNVASLVAYRDGLMIALLSLRPIRRHAFSMIRIGIHLRQVGEEWRIAFNRSEMKSGRPFVITVPQRIAPFLEHYLRQVRPRILGANRHDHLWAGAKGGPLTDKTIYCVIAERTRQALGQPVNPHLFRHCAATTIAILQPGRIGVARDLLDHVSLVTTNAHYNKAHSIEAGRLYAKVLNDLARRSPRRSRSRSQGMADPLFRLGPGAHG
jgi:integrase/recombinase XerD